MRHATTLEKVPGQTDLERELTPLGHSQAVTAGLWLKEKKLVPDLILCSPAVRTQSTLAGVLAGLGVSVPVQTEKDIYHGDEEDLMHLLETVDASVQTLLYIGHNPTIGYFANALTQRRVSFSPATILDLVPKEEDATGKATSTFHLQERFIAPVDSF
ncbi:histidine phosphatase family protein [Rufibacter sp. DG15C]|uniref:SixA phosphatase family protein n=1 Tax=Rufibacter sp. DG15C TaxID=1379909 RepID=UPI0018D3E092|nr:histidine phosphatase family protein [Rufibacter sp. DG15C]